jgi:hypothetical protein
MAANANAWALGSVNQHGRVPAHPRTVGALDGFVTWKLRL